MARHESLHQLGQEAEPAHRAGPRRLSALNVPPQLYKSWRTKRTTDLSYSMLGVVMGGNVLWVLHGLHRADAALITANAVLLLTAAALTLLKARYDSSGRGSVQ